MPERSPRDWKTLRIAIVGGDRREQEIARQAAATAATVWAYGLPWPPEGIPGVALASSAAAALAGADVALFPIPGMSAAGALFAPAAPAPIVPDRAMLAAMRAPAHVVLGQANEALKADCAALGITLHEYESDEELMLRRGPAIVEGLLRVLIENTDITVHRAQTCVVGQGTIGSMITRYLVALGARTHVAARNPAQRAAAWTAGADAHELGELSRLAPDLDILVSTVPVRVIGREVLERLPRSALVVDVAAPPGGIDLDAARALGLRAVWARGLGARAPITVGASQWQGIRKRIEAVLREER